LPKGFASPRFRRSKTTPSVTVIHQDSPDKYSVVETVKTLPRAKTMAFDPQTHKLFLSTAENGQFEVLVVGK